MALPLNRYYNSPSPLANSYRS